jgi:hypothetical protein
VTHSYQSPLIGDVSTPARRHIDYHRDPPTHRLETPVARAKRTARADARRRYRAENQLDEPGDLDDADAEPAQSRGSGSAPSAPGRLAPGQRIGIGKAFRLAFRPLDIRSDLQVLPTLIRSKALWVPLALTAGALGLVVTVGLQGTDVVNVVASLLYQYFIFTPAIGGAFLAGFLAPRASWFYGLVVGLAAAISFAILVLGVPSLVYPPPLPDAAVARDLVGSAFALSPILGSFFASAAAWYRRFLQLSSPNRARQAQQPRRGTDGRSRATPPKTGTRR